MLSHPLNLFVGANDMISQRLLAAFFTVVFLCASAAAQTTAFSYQGSLRDGANPANGNYDFEFRLFDALAGGAQQGSTLQRLNVAVANGIFTVSLDFGASVLPGADRFLEIGLRVNGNQGGFQQLLPRQRIGSSPYSIRSLTAENAISATTATTATNATQLGGVAANQYVLTTDPRLADARPPTAGSANYIQNSTSTQAASNFNISGNGTAGGTLRGDIVRADTRYNIGISPFISIAGVNNTFVGILNGDANTTGTDNSFFGRSAGTQNTTGASNSFFGSSAGSANTTGSDNSFFGRNAGSANTTASSNSFFGASAGVSNTVGDDNSFFGKSAGAGNTSGSRNTIVGRSAGFNTTTGDSNSFYGRSAGYDNTTGGDNSFFGSSAGDANTTGYSNSFVGFLVGGNNTTGARNSFLGERAGISNQTGSNNTAIGAGSNVGSNLSYATAIGADSDVSASNTIALGRADGTDRVRAYGNLIVNGTVNIGSFAASTSTNLCTSILGTVSLCSSSIRYKNDVASLGSGLDVVSRLRPVTFRWNESGEKDLGLIAEEVESIDPLLVTYNQNDQIQGVKYDQLTVVLINAAKEQQAQIEVLGKQNQSLVEKVERQQLEIDELKKKTAELDELKAYICRQNPGVQICRP